MKTCKHPTCTYPVFSHLYCKSHQYLREDKKQEPLQKYSERVKMHEVSFGYDTQWEMFMDLWSNAKDVNARVICPYTGEQLNKYNHTNLFWNCFAHVLDKKNWIYFRLNPENVRVVYPEFHRIVDAGTLAERKLHAEWKWDEWDALVLEMKQKYAEFKKENLLP